MRQLSLRQIQLSRSRNRYLARVTLLLRFLKKLRRILVSKKHRALRNQKSKPLKPSTHRLKPKISHLKINQLRRRRMRPPKRAQIRPPTLLTLLIPRRKLMNQSTKNPILQINRKTSMSRLMIKPLKRLQILPKKSQAVLPKTRHLQILLQSRSQTLMFQKMRPTPTLLRKRPLLIQPARRHLTLPPRRHLTLPQRRLLTLPPRKPLQILPLRRLQTQPAMKPQKTLLLRRPLQIPQKIRAPLTLPQKRKKILIRQQRNRLSPSLSLRAQALRNKTLKPKKEKKFPSKMLGWSLLALSSWHS